MAINRNRREQEIYDLMSIVSNTGVDLVGKRLLTRLKFLHTVDLMVKQTRDDSISEKLKKLGE